jgi:hypothetical protein
VHDRPWFHVDNGFWSWWAVAQSTVGPYLVVMSPPLFDQDLRLSEAIKDLSVEQLIAEPSIEALAVAVLPR